MEKTSQATLYRWKLFCLSVELGSFLKVAEKLGTDATFVRKAVDVLESYCGESLLARTKRGVRPTWIGEQYYRRVKPVLGRTDDLINHFGQRIQGQMGNKRLRLAVPSLLSTLFIRWVTEFEETSVVSVKIDVVPYEERLFPSVENYDWMISVGDLPEEHMIAQPMGALRRGVAARKSFIDTVGVVNEPEGLLREKVLSLEASPTLISGEESITLRLSASFRVHHWMMLLERARMTDAYAVGVPLWILQEGAPYQDLKRVLPQWEMLPETVWLLKKKNDAFEDRKQNFEHFLILVSKSFFVPL